MNQNSRKRIDLSDNGVALAGTAESDSGAGPTLIAARRVSLMLWAVVLLGIAARLARYFLCFPLWEDEAMLGTNFLDRGYLGLAEGLDNMQVAPLLFLWSVETLVNWFGFTEYTLRAVAFISGIASLLLFVLATRRIYNGVPWLLSVGFFAVAYRMIRHGAELKAYSSDAFCGILLLTLLIYWVATERKNVWLWAMALLMPLLLGLSFPIVFLAGGVSAGIAWELWRNADRRGLLPWVVLNLLLIGSFVTYFMLTTRAQIDVNQQGMNEYWSLGFPPIDQPLQVIPWLLNVTLGDMFAFPIGGPNFGSALTVICIMVGLCVLARRNWSAIAVVFFVAMALQFIASVMHRYPFGGSSRLVMHLAPLACMLAGLGAARLIIWKVPGSGRLIGSWSVYVLFTVLMLLGVGCIARDVTRPYKYYDMVNERSFARWFWYNQAYDAELVCLYSDRESVNAPDHEAGFHWAVYLCNQAIYSPRHHRNEPPDLSRVDAKHPLRCVHYAPSAELLGNSVGPWDPEQRAIGEWLDRMKLRYELVRRDEYHFPYHYPGRPTEFRSMEVFEFIPLEPVGN
jgi:hypothetical protein